MAEKWDVSSSGVINRAAGGSSVGQMGKAVAANHSAGETETRHGSSIFLAQRIGISSAVPLGPGQDGLSASGFAGSKTHTSGTAANANNT